LAIPVKQNTSIAIETEVTEGTYVDVAGASSFVQTLADGLEFKKSKELLERNVFAGTIGAIVPRTGTRSVSGTIPTECRALSTAGGAPEFDKLMESALGDKRQISSTTTTKSSGNTGTTLEIEDADISKFNVGDIIMVKQSGAYHVSPITAVDDSSGAANITLLVAKPSGSFANSVVIEKATTYVVAESGHPTLSITKYVDGAIREYATGCRVNKMSLENFATGKLPSLSFGFDGLNFDTSLTAPTYSPSYDSANPPIVLDGRAYVDGTAITVNNISVSLENSVGFATSLDAANGKVASRVTKRKVTGTMDPYQDTTSIANYTKFVNNTQFSLFAYAKNDSGVAGQMQNVVAIYMPNCIITELSEADSDGLLQDSISFTASTGSAGTAKEIYFAFI
jgi:hypothetical protein